MNIYTKKLTAQEMLDKGITKYFRVSGVFLMLIAVLSVGVAGTAHVASVQAEKEKCSGFIIQSNAQSVFDSNPIRYKALDRDHDGKACENLP